MGVGVTFRSPIWSVLVCHCAVGCLLAILGWLILPGLTIELWGHLTLECGPLQTRHEWRNLQFCLVHPCSLLKLLQSSLCPTLTLGLPCMSVAGGWLYLPIMGP